MSTVKFLKAAIEKVGIDTLVNNLANLNYDIRIYSRLLFGIDVVTQRDVETYVMKESKNPVRKINSSISNNLFELYNVTIHYESQEFRYINEKDAIPEDLNIKEFNNYCIEHKINWADELSDNYNKPISVFIEATIYRPIEDITK